MNTDPKETLSLSLSLSLSLCLSLCVSLSLSSGIEQRLFKGDECCTFLETKSRIVSPASKWSYCLMTSHFQSFFVVVTIFLLPLFPLFVLLLLLL